MADHPRYQHPNRRSGTEAPPFFDLLIPEHAYLFGLLQTDGCHSAGARNRGRISLELAVRDIRLLEQIADLCPWHSSVRVRTRDTNFSEGYTTATWTLSSWDARHELEALGLPPGPKSRSAAPPVVPVTERDYVRGLLDGDGSVGFTGRGSPFVSFVTASESLARYVEAFGLKITGVRRCANPNTRDGVFNPMYQTDAAAELARTIWKPGDLALERKAETAIRVATWTRPPEMRQAYRTRRWTDDEDLVVMEHRPLQAIADQLGRSYQSVSLRRMRLRNRTEDS